MFAFSCGLTAAEAWCNGFAERNYYSDRKCMACTSKNIDTIEELVLIQEGAPVTLSTK